MLKKNSVRVSLEGKDEKEASKVIPAGEKIPLCIITKLYPIHIDRHQVLSLVSPLRLLLLSDDWKQLENHVDAREDTPIFIYNSR